MNVSLIWAIPGCAAALSSLPGSIELLALTLGAMLPARRFRETGRTDAFRLAIVIPAHNEENQIGSTVLSVLAANRTGLTPSVVVIADNCSDGTAAMAEEAGARTLIRVNNVERGKGYALNYAFQVLLPEGYDGFLIVDADTEISHNVLTEVAKAFRSGAEAVQCRYVVRNPADSIRTRLMSVALLGFNVARPRGRDRLGLSAGINGNGFGLSAETLRSVPYGAASVVEDLEYHLDLVRAGRKVRFANEAIVRGDMPVGGKGVKTQRTRWEGGRIRMLLERAPALAGEVLRGRIALLEPLGDLVLLPLAFHSTLLILAAIIPFGPSRLIGLAGLGIVALHLLVAIVVGGGGWQEIVVLLCAPFYVAWKIMLLPAVLASSRAKTAWVRTERDHEEKQK